MTSPPWVPMEAIEWAVGAYYSYPSFGTHRVLGIVVGLAIGAEHTHHTQRLGSCPICRGA